MMCQECGQPATVHLTDIVNKQKRETHLCAACAARHDLIPDTANPQLNLPALVALLSDPGAAGAESPADSGGLTCPKCGLKYAVFRAEGRLGCPTDYDAFRPTLEPLIERIHRTIRHVGKTPRKAGRAGEMAALKADLAAAVAAEDYEEAARLRDRIRQKALTDEPG